MQELLLLPERGNLPCFYQVILVVYLLFLGELLVNSLSNSTQIHQEWIRNSPFFLLPRQSFSHYLVLQHSYKENRPAQFIPLSFSSCLGSSRCLSSQLITSESKTSGLIKDINLVPKINLIYWHRPVGKDLWKRPQLPCHINQKQQQQSIQPTQAQSTTEKCSFSSSGVGDDWQQKAAK